MADSTEVRALLLQISANTELLRSNLSEAEKAVASFHADTTKHLDDSDARFEVFGKNIEKLEAPLQRLKSLGEVAIGALLGESLLSKGKEALEFAGNIEFVSKQIGVTTDFLQKYRYAAGQFGVGTEEADQGLTKFTRSIGEAANGNKEIISVLDRLGVKIFDAGGKLRSTESIYADVSNGIKKYDTAAQGLADTQTLLGRGSAGLAPLLREGSDGFNALAQAAQALGVVLSPELIEHSEQVNHKLAALKQVVDAQMASSIAQNAQAIEALATALIQAAGATTRYLNSHPETALAILGGLSGLRLGGVPGAIAGSLGGLVVGTGYKLDQQDNDNDLTFRRQELHAARERLARARQSDMSPDQVQQAQEAGLDVPTVSGAMQTLRNQIAYMQRALAASGRGDGGAPGSTATGVTNNSGAPLKEAETQLADLEKEKVGASGAALTAYNEEIAQKKRVIAFMKEGATAEMANTLASKEGAAVRKGETDEAKAAKKAEEDRRKAVQEQLSFEQEQLRLQKSILGGAAHSVANDAARDVLEKQIIDQEASELASRIGQQRDSILADKDASQARKDAAVAHAKILLGLNEQDRLQKDANVDLQARVRAQQAETAKAALSLQGSIDLLQLDDRLATTRAERLRIELKLLDYQEQLAIKAQQAIIDSKDPTVTQDQRDAAQTRIDQINAQHGRNVELVKRQNAGPLDQYKQQLQTDGEDAYQNLEVDGLKNLEDGLAGVITGTKSLKSAFHDMAESIVADLAKIAIEKAFTSILGSAFGGASPDLSGFDPISAAATAPTLPAFDPVMNFGGGRAAGGGIDPSKYYLVGENGPELFAPGMSGTVIPNGALRSPTISSATLRAGSSSPTIQMGDIHLNAPGADPRQLAQLQAQFQRSQAELPARVVAAWQDAHDRLMVGRA